jgi:hypothetical protein
MAGLAIYVIIDRFSVFCFPKWQIWTFLEGEVGQKGA